MLDLITKLVAEATLLRTPGISVVGDWFQLRLVYNQGAAFGLHVGPYSRWIFFTVALVAVFVLARMSRSAPGGRSLPPARPGPGGRRRGGQPDRPDPERPRRGGLPRRRHRRPPLADLQRRRHRGELRRDRAGDLALAGGRPPPRTGRRLGCLSSIFTVSAEATERLDRFLADQLGLSRTQAARLVADKAVDVDGKPARASRLLLAASASPFGSPITSRPAPSSPPPIPLTVVFEDEHLAVIDKPAGLVVHPAPGHWDDTLVNALVARGTTLSRRRRGPAGHRAPARPRYLRAHGRRQDRPGPPAARRRDRRAAGRAGPTPRSAWGHLDESPDGDRGPDRPASAGPEAHGRRRPAAGRRGPTPTSWPGSAWRTCSGSSCTPAAPTRSGSISSMIGHPIVGDPVYGGGGSRRISGAARRAAEALERATPRQALHAAALAFRHPASGERRSNSAPNGRADLRPALLALGAEELGCSP